MIKGGLALSLSLIAATASAQQNPLRVAFYQCFTEAWKASNFVETLASPNEKRPAQSKIILMCEGVSAQRLFSAIEFASSQETKNGAITRRTEGNAVSCHGPAGTAAEAKSFMCFISIETGERFYEAIR